jgi:hypothetical protein
MVQKPAGPVGSLVAEGCGMNPEVRKGLQVDAWVGDGSLAKEGVRVGFSCLSFENMGSHPKDHGAALAGLCASRVLATERPLPTARGQVELGRRGGSSANLPLPRGVLLGSPRPTNTTVPQPHSTSEISTLAWRQVV